ncbi:MAG: acyl-CoA thioesterase [Betaproteobacteria bacterium]
MAWGDFRHRLPLRVRWAEVDMQGVVFNGHYLTYCDVCVTEYWRAIGLRYPQDVVRHGADIFLRKATVEYHAPAVYDDELLVCGRSARLGRSSLRFVVEMYRRGAQEAPLLEAELIYVNADPASKQSAPWSQSMRELIVAYEPLALEEAQHAKR